MSLIPGVTEIADSLGVNAGDSAHIIASNPDNQDSGATFNIMESLSGLLPDIDIRGTISDLINKVESTFDSIKSFFNELVFAPSVADARAQASADSGAPTPEQPSIEINNF